MAGKSKAEKKKRAKTKKREKELLRQKVNHKAKLGNNAEPVPAEINEDAGKPEPGGIEVPRMEDGKPEKPDHEPVSFDPKSIVANILKKKGGA